MYIGPLDPLGAPHTGDKWHNVLHWQAVGCARLCARECHECPLTALALVYLQAAVLAPSASECRRLRQRARKLVARAKRARWRRKGWALPAD